MATVKALDGKSLLQRCDPQLFPFQTTAELTAVTEIVGQSRAVEAVRFGLDIQQQGYNLFVLGEPGSGRHSVVRRLLEAKAAECGPPSDWCHVNNFADENRPRLLRVPAGRGAKFKRDMHEFVTELSKAVEAAFDSDEYRGRMEALHSESKDKEEGALRELGQESANHGVALLRTPHGFAFAPMKGEEAMEPEEFAKLPDAEKERIGKLIEGYSERLRQLMLQFPRWRRELQSRIRATNRDTLGLAVGHLVEELKEQYRDLPGVLAFLDEVMDDVIETGDRLREPSKSEEAFPALGTAGRHTLARYQVNLLVDNAGARAAPVLHEDNPVYTNLVGRVDHMAQLGALVTDFTLVKPGALHRANGGYLVLDAVKVLSQPYSWEGLKRALRSRQVRIESLGQVFGFGGTISLEPEPMPLSVKVVLVGERWVYYLLKASDPEFAELFKVAADLESDLPRDAESTRVYAEFVATLARDSALRPLDRGAVARVVEHSARLSGSADKLSVSRRRIVELLQEADHGAARAGRAVVAREDVEAALAARLHRLDRVRSRLHESILRDDVLISVSGANIGQVNGLAIVPVDDLLFGHPVRITATVRMGEGDVIDILRESELGGALHSKGVMILASFLGARFSREMPLSFSASLVFEQSYGPVEGDSASLAELCALISSLAMVPIRQALAVTGSVNQYGRVQAIGGVNEKIEGFFDICRARGLEPGQGVVIPASNVKHLMLRDDVVRACEEGRFAIHAVESVDQAIELLTGVPAGEPGPDGQVPDGTVNYQVAAQLLQMTALRRAYVNSSRGRLVRKKVVHHRKKRHA